MSQFGMRRPGARGPEKSAPPATWRAVVHRLLQTGKLAPGDYLAALGLGPGPKGWAFALFVFFGAAQIAAGFISFFAFNWRELSDIARIVLPQAVMIAAFLGWAALPARSAAGTIAGIIATLSIGVSMGVVGQVYQLGADPWTLFASWAALALPLALIARNDAHLAVWAAIASIAYFLYTEEVLRPVLPFGAIPAIHAGLMLALLFIRDFAFGGAPAWQRWLFAGAALISALAGAFGDIFKSRLFEDGAIGTFALLAASGAVFIAYSAPRPDRPARALALFAVAVLIGALGVRVIFEGGDFEGAIEAAMMLILAALWVVGVTAGLALALRKTAGAAQEGAAQ